MWYDLDMINCILLKSSSSFMLHKLAVVFSFEFIDKSSSSAG